jgi:hypothetical protein
MWLRAASFLSLVLLAACSGDGNRVASGGACSSNRDCAAGNACIAGTCKQSSSEKECATDETCQLGEFCDPVSFQCVPLAPIDPKPDAGASENDSGTDPSVSCTSDQVCAPHQYCDLATSTCVNGRRSCTDDTACAPIGQHCDVAKGSCVDCLEEAHCVEPMKCTEGECLDPSIDTSCNDDTGCAPPMSVCVGSMCVRGCATPNGLMCTGGNLCNEATGHCENPAGCSIDSDCGAPAGVCEAGTCLPGCGQIGGISCGTGSVCDTGTGRCVVVLGPCSSDATCTPPSTVCETGQCVPGCAEPGGVQCVGATRCNPMNGRCEAGGDFCASDLDCMTPAEICNLSTGDCLPGCATAGCTAPDTCNTTSGHCVGPAVCANDGFEENDTLAAPAQITGGVISNLFSCPNDDDYYAILMGALDTLTVDASFVFGEGNIDLQLYNPAGTVVASGTLNQSNETLTFAAVTAGTHVLRVFLQSDLGASPGNSYTLNVQHNAAPCAQDTYEDNDTELTGRALAPGNYNTMNVCVMDDDFYDIPVNSGDTIAASVTFMNPEGDIDLRLLNPLGFSVASSGGTGNTESINFTANLTGTYTLRVYLFTENGAIAGNPYSLSLTVTPAMSNPTTCTADALEENDTQAAARSLPGNSGSNLTSCTGDDDFYSFALGAGDRIAVNVTFSDAEGDIDIALLNSGGTSVASSAGTADNESLNYTTAAAGTYALRVLLYGDAGSAPGNTYGVNVTVTPPASSGCSTTDPYEPNNSQAAGAALSFGSVSNLGICTADDDYYALALTAGDAFDALVTFVDAEGDIDVTLINAAGTVVASSAGVVDNEHVTYTVPTTGTYTLRVYLYGDGGTNPGNLYGMTVSR